MKRIHLFPMIIVLASFLSLHPKAFASAEIQDVNGSVTVNGKAMSIGDSIQLNDNISTTGPDTSFVDLTLPGGHRIRLKNAQGSFRSLDETIRLKLKKGKAFSYINENKSPANYRIVTEHGIAGIRGTKFFLQAKPDQMYVCVCEGTVHVNKVGFWAEWFGETRAVEAGYDFHVYSDKPLSDPTRSPGMVRRTWRVFQDMGLDVPDRFEEE